MSRMLLIVPSRKRPKSCDEVLKEFTEQSVCSDIIFGLDDDDKSVYSPEVLAKAEINPRMRMGGTLNFLAKKYADQYDFLGFIGDDHRPRTKGWDELLCNAIGDKPGVAYGNDLLQGQNLPTAVVLSSSIVRRIGYMVPPTLIHMYMDNFWMDFGDAIGNLQYRDDVIVEHLHYLAGKAVNDLQYQEVNAPHVYENDRVAYELYVSAKMSKDVALVLGE